jgi:hypothetical protein
LPVPERPAAARPCHRGVQDDIEALRRVRLGGKIFELLLAEAELPEPERNADEIERVHERVRQLVELEQAHRLAREALQRVDRVHALDIGAGPEEPGMVREELEAVLAPRLVEHLAHHGEREQAVAHAFAAEHQGEPVHGRLRHGFHGTVLWGEPSYRPGCVRGDSCVKSHQCG